MPTLTPFWRFLEQRPTAAAVMSEWQSRLGTELSFITPLLSPQNTLARSVPHSSTQTPLRVVKHRDGTFVAVADEEPAIRIALSRGDLVVHQVDARKLRQTIAGALRDVVPGRAPLDLGLRQFRVGFWRPKPGAEFPIDLVVPRDTAALTAAVDAAQAPCFLLTPTQSVWNDALRQRATARKVMLVALDEILQADDAGWIQTPAWPSYLGAFAAMIGTSLPANYQNRRKPAKRAPRLVTIDKLTHALQDHLRAARDHAFDLQKRGRPMHLLPRPEQKDLARLLTISETAVSRALNDPTAKVLHILWETADSLELVLRFK